MHTRIGKGWGEPAIQGLQPYVCYQAAFLAVVYVMLIIRLFHFKQLPVVLPGQTGYWEAFWNILLE